MLHIRKVSNYNEFASCVALRTLVFSVEQGIGIDTEFDEFEISADHYIASLDRETVATARTRILNNGVGKIERIVVKKEHRNKGFGSAVVQHVSNTLADENHIWQIEMSAQVTALPFYKNLGYKSVGKEYMQANIPHIKIIKDLGKQ